MTRDNDSIRDTRPERLAELMDAANRSIWGPDELGAVLEHQLGAPLELSLPGSASLQGGLEGKPGPVGNLRELLQQADPPVELLRLGKDFAKSVRVRAETPLPPEVATVLYFSCISAALVHGNSRISGLSDELLRNGLQWALERSWLDAQTRALLLEGLDALAPTAGEGPAED